MTDDTLNMKYFDSHSPKIEEKIVLHKPDIVCLVSDTVIKKEGSLQIFSTSDLSTVVKEELIVGESNTCHIILGKNCNSKESGSVLPDICADIKNELISDIVDPALPAVSSVSLEEFILPDSHHDKFFPFDASCSTEDCSCIDSETHVGLGQLAAPSSQVLLLSEVDGKKTNEENFVFNKSVKFTENVSPQELNCNSVTKNECSTCKKIFSTLSNLKQHILIKHSCDKKCKCDVCGKIFSNSLYLSRHKLTHNDKKYQCDKCDKVFKRLPTLAYHKSLHSGLKPYQCDICKKCFTYPSVLHVHKFIHSCITKFRCNVCNKAFTQENNLLRHKKIHSCIEN